MSAGKMFIMSRWGMIFPSNVTGQSTRGNKCHVPSIVLGKERFKALFMDPSEKLGRPLAAQKGN